MELVKKLDNDTKAEIAKLSATQAKLMKEWRDALEIRMYKTLLPEVQKTFEEDICKEFGTMKDRIMEKRKALHANFIGGHCLKQKQWRQSRYQKLSGLDRYAGYPGKGEISENF